MIKVEIQGWFLIDWLLKSLGPEICKDATMMGARIEQEVILRTQQLDLIYSQSRMLYNILPNAPPRRNGSHKSNTWPSHRWIHWICSWPGNEFNGKGHFTTKS